MNTHEFIIRPNTKIITVQKNFNAVFPFLKLEFVKHRHGPNGSSSKKDLLAPHALLEIIAKGDHKTKAVIDENMTVAEVEALFMSQYGLSAQVFRKSGRLWLETTVTDDWTLKKQNMEGHELSTLQA